MEKVCKELEQNNNIKTGYISIDLELFPSKEFSSELLVKKVEEIIGKDKLKLLVCNAGMSDLAVHFTDKPLERNLSLMKLNMFSTVALVQTLIPRLVKDSLEDKIKGGLITLSAVTSLIAAPTFAISAANKSFVRGFTRSLAYEFKDNLQVMVANPLAVSSGIVKEKMWNVYPADRFVSGILKSFSQGKEEACGTLFHDLQCYYYRVFATQSMFNWFYTIMLDENSRVLGRKIDKRPVVEKLGLS